MNFLFIYHQEYFTGINYNKKNCKNLYIIKCWNILLYYDVDMKYVNWKRHSVETYYQKIKKGVFNDDYLIYIYIIYIYI